MEIKNKLEYFKKELKAILNKQLEESNSVKKSFSERIDELLKAYNRGHLVPKQVNVRNSKGKVFSKTVYINPNKQNGLNKYHETDSKGAKIAIAKLIKAVDRCQSSQELLNLVLKNKGRFSDEFGRPLPIVNELREYVSEKNDKLEKYETTSNQKTDYESQKKVKRKNADSYNKKRAEHIRQDVKLNEVNYEEKLLSRNEAQEKIKQNEGKGIQNKETGITANYNSKGAGKLISQKAINKSIKNGFSTEEHFTIASHIKELFENANLVSTEPDRDSDLNDNVIEVRRYAIKFNLNGKSGFALMTIKLNKDETKKIYALELDYLKKIKPATSGEVKDNSNHETLAIDKPRRQTGSTDNIPQSDNSVKENNNDVNNESEKRATELKSHIESVFDKYMNDSSTRNTAKTIVKKYGKKKLEDIANNKIKDDEEYKKFLTERVASVEKEEGKQLDDDTIDMAIWKHCTNVYIQKLAREKLKSMEANEKMVDLPVSNSDMNEAIDIIGSDVTRILNGRDTYGNAKQGLVDKIKRRVRNSPGVARAMLVYIKREQEKTGKKVFTEKHSIWDYLPKLNEQARAAAEKGESETKTGVSGALYTGDDGTTVVENKNWGRYQISFPGKPDYETISTLKHNGFRWSPKTQTWVCYNTANGEYSLKQVAEKLGLKKTEIKKSSLEMYVEKSIKILKNINIV